MIVGIKVVRRQLFLRGLRLARIDPGELRAQLDAAAPLFLVDLRHAQDFAADARVIPGALRFAAEELEQRHEAIPRDRDIVLYCT